MSVLLVTVTDEDGEMLFSESVDTEGGVFTLRETVRELQATLEWKLEERGVLGR